MLDLAATLTWWREYADEAAGRSAREGASEVAGDTQAPLAAGDSAT